MRKRWFGCAAAALIILAVSMLETAAIGLIVVDETKPDQASVRRFSSFTPLEIRSVKVDSRIQNQVAETRIEQEFYNGSSRRLEGTFYLPLPKGAHLQKFSMEVNGKMTEAELLTADKAKGIYEEIVRKAQDPALLEYIGRDLVKVRIFPIEPHSSKRVEVSYAQLLKSEDGLASFVLPLSAGRHCAGAIKSLAARVSIKGSSGLKTIYSPSHMVEIVRLGENEAKAGFELSNVRPEKDFQLFYSTAKGRMGLSALTYKEEGEDGYFMLLATPGMTEAKAEAKDVVFVFDTSGSMAGAKIEQARKALLFCVNNLRAEDRFEVVRFSTEAEAFFQKLAPASKENIAKAEAFVRSFKPTGGTAIHDALQEALRFKDRDSTRPTFVVFVTDGLPTVGMTGEEAILESVKRSAKGARVFCFGLGTDVNAHLLDKVAEQTGALSQYVLPDEDLEVKLSAFFAKISDPVLSDVQVNFEGLRTSKVHPGKMPDLFKGQQAVVFGRFAKEGLGCVVLTGTINGQRQEFRFETKFEEKQNEREFIPRLWATRRVGYLLDEIRLRGEAGELKEEVIALAKRYGIVTPYTSFLVQEDQEPVLAAGNLPQPAQGPAANPMAIRNIPELRRYVPQISAEKSGDAAVAAARYGAKLKEAENEASVQVAPREYQFFSRSGRLSSLAERDESLDGPSERYVGGRIFRNRGGVWTETTAAELKNRGAVRRIEFNSPEYWDFATAHLELREVLALGRDVEFVHQDKVVIVFSKKN